MTTSILDTSIDQLREDQLKALREHFCGVLEEIRNLFMEEKYQEIADKYVKWSPAGDEMGCDNHFINFYWHPDADECDVGDILQMAAKLSNKKINLDN